MAHPRTRRESVMQPTTRLWTGRALSALAVLFMLFDTIGHLLRNQPVVDAFARLGYPLSLSVGLAIVELVCTIAYVFQPTSILGAHRQSASFHHIVPHLYRDPRMGRALAAGRAAACPDSPSTQVAGSAYVVSSLLGQCADQDRKDGGRF